MNLLERLDTFRAAGVLADLDVHFARFVGRLAGSETPELVLAAALVSHRIGGGQPCADLAALAGRVVLPGLDDDPDGGEPIVAPLLAPWTAALRATNVVGAPGDDRPLVLDQAGRLYLHRYWCYERSLALDLRARAEAVVHDVDVERLRADLATLFPSREDVPDWQRIAAATAVLRRLCIISGGPGTGKTTTVIRILALLLAQQPEIRIALAAPTGKAAARMQEAIRAAKDRVALPTAVLACIPDEASTIHRLLGARPGSSRLRHDRSRPLALDALVVDEASMVDLALMAKLVAALPADARLVVLGDRDQLASVEAGAVLGDLCGTTPGFSDAFRQRLEAVTGETIPPGQASASSMQDAVVLLTRSHRFTPTSGIGRLAAAVNRGDGTGVVAILRDPGADDVRWRSDGSLAELVGMAADGYAAYLELVTAGARAEEIFAAFRRFRVLCAHRRGPWGVETLNQRVDEELRRRLAVEPELDWYAGRPVLVTQNDYALGLFNGDVGIALADPEMPERLRVAFETARGGLRRLAPTRLPTHEAVWAMTAHKSQGSEFDRILLALPADDSPLVTRELVYTGITRARQAVDVWGSDTVLLAGVARRLVRSSGLREALWGSDIRGEMDRR
jgi:exodeoxyribonuclease V alpha subunit